MSDNRPCFVGLTVRNYEACIRFYCDAMGVPLKPGEEYAHQECSWRNPYFHFAIFPLTAKQPFLAFAVDDVDEAHKRAVAAGAKVVHGPEELPWGRAAQYVDPEGNLVSLVELPIAKPG